MTEQRAAVRRG